MRRRSMHYRYPPGVRDPNSGAIPAPPEPAAILQLQSRPLLARFFSRLSALFRRRKRKRVRVMTAGQMLSVERRTWR